MNWSHHCKGGSSSSSSISSSSSKNNNKKLHAIGLSPDVGGYFTCKQNMKLVTTRFKSGGLHQKHVVATWNVGNRLSVCL